MIHQLIYLFSDQQSNAISAKWKHQSISSSLRCIFILKFPDTCVSPTLSKCTSFVNIQTVLVSGRWWHSERSRDHEDICSPLRNKSAPWKLERFFFVWPQTEKKGPAVASVTDCVKWEDDIDHGPLNQIKIILLQTLWYQQILHYFPKQLMWFCIWFTPLKLVSTTLYTVRWFDLLVPNQDV